MCFKIFECVMTSFVCYCRADKSFFLSRYPFIILIYKLFQSYFEIFHEFIFFTNDTVIIDVIKYCSADRASLFLHVSGIILFNVLCKHHIVTFRKIDFVNSIYVILLCYLVCYNCLSIKHFR